MNQNESLIKASINSLKAGFFKNSLNFVLPEVFIEFNAFFLIFIISTGIGRDKLLGSYGGG